MQEAPNGVSPAEARAEVESVLASTLFGRAPTLSRILKYVCEQHFQGKAADIKEYSVAVEALGRSAGFDPADDSIVRVEAARLRRHLRKYYETDGASHLVQIRIADVGYAPQFVSTGLGKGPPAGGSEAPENLPSARRFRSWWMLGLILAGAVALGFAFAATRTFGGRSLGALFSLHPPPPAIPTPESGIRIRVGSSHPGFLDANAANWLSDRYFDGGVTFGRPSRQILRTVDQALYQSGREGNFSYAVPLKQGAYELHLHFAETFFGQGPSSGAEKERLFDVRLNGAPLLAGFDIAADAAGANVADEKVFKDVVPAQDGFLRLEFTQRRNGAVLNGIEILSGIPGKMRPVRIVCGRRAYYDKRGSLWSSDRYFAGGRLGERSRPVEGTEEPELYGGSRWGNFTYAIPVADGAYRVRLYFAEVAWGPKTSQGGGAGSRLFDIYCNGRALRTRFDLFQEAGGQDRAVELEFRRLKPNAQNKLVFSFVPIVDYAVISAIEVEDEGA